MVNAEQCPTNFGTVLIYCFSVLFFWNLSVDTFEQSFARKTERKTERQTDGQTDGQMDRQTYRSDQTDRNTRS